MARYTGSQEVTYSQYTVRVSYAIESSAAGWLAYITAIDAKMSMRTGTYDVNLFGGFKINGTKVGVEFDGLTRTIYGKTYSNYFTGTSNKINIGARTGSTVNFNIGFYKVNTYASGDDQLFLYGRGGSTVVQNGLPETPNSGISVSVSIKTFTLSKQQGAHTSLSTKVNGVEIANGGGIYDGDTLNISFAPASGYKAACTLNGAEIPTGYAWSVSGNAEVISTASPLGFVYIDDGANTPYQVRIDNGGSIDLYRAYIDNGTAIVPY